MLYKYKIKQFFDQLGKKIEERGNQKPLNFIHLWIELKAARWAEFCKQDITLYLRENDR